MVIQYEYEPTVQDVGEAVNINSELHNIGSVGLGSRGGGNYEHLGDINNMGGQRNILIDKEKSLSLSYNLVGLVGTPNDRVFNFAVKIYSGQAKKTAQHDKDV